MSISTFTSREFNQNPNKAKIAAQHGVVFITERGIVSHVLLKINDYNKMGNSHGSIVDLLAMPEGDDLDFEPIKISKPLFHRDVF